ncbi:hypothetical protein K3495_g3018 [Podosphaera aphanis]|nr:hypothetical protein K3495_g3018 [Podosphaera aphanis]
MGHHSSKPSGTKRASFIGLNKSSKSRPSSAQPMLPKVTNPIDTLFQDEYENNQSSGSAYQQTSASQNRDFLASSQAIKSPVKNKAIKSSVKDKAIKSPVKDKAIKSPVKGKAIKSPVKDKAIKSSGKDKGLIVNQNLNPQDPECLIAQLEALLENPEKFSTHHNVIARLAYRVSNLLEGGFLIDQLQELIDEPQKYSRHEEKLTILTRRASTVFETPFQTYHRVVYSGLLLVLGRIAQDRGLLKILCADKAGAFGAVELAEKTGINQKMLEIFLEYLAGQHIIDHAGEFFYQANNITRNLSEPVAIHGLSVFHDLLFPVLRCLGDSLGDVEGRTAHQIAFQTSLDLPSWLGERPELEKEVSALLQHQWDLVPSWLGVVDFPEEFAHDSDEHSFIFVDVCGGSGDQCIALLQKYPHLKGRVFLQDTPAILQRAQVPDRVEKVPYEIFEDQYIRGANVYYLRQVFHTRSDEAVVRILQSQLPAMRDDSVLLIDEKVIPDMILSESPSLLNVVEMSILMVACFKTPERRLSEWIRLIYEAGYEVAQIHPYSDLQDCVIITKRNLKSSTWKPQLMDHNDVLRFGFPGDLLRR